RVGAPKDNNLAGQTSYIGYRAVMAAFEVAIFGVVLLSFVGFAVGVALGPICILFALFSATASWFNLWLSSLIKFAMMRVVGAIVLAIIVQIVHLFFSVIPWYMYIIDLQDIFLFFVAVMLACLYLTFKIPSLTADYFGGSHGSVSGLGNWIS